MLVTQDLLRPENNDLQIREGEADCTFSQHKP